MTIDKLNGNKLVAAGTGIAASKLTAANSTSHADEIALQNGLSGADKKYDAPKTETMTPNERKAGIKEYQENNNCSKKEAKAAFDREFGEIDKMSRKEAKEWLKSKMEETGCTKKEAKEAFKEEFGYDVPLSIGTKIGRHALLALGLPVGGGGVSFIGSLALAGSKFLTGQGKNDAKYEKRLQEQDNTVTKDNNRVTEYKDKDGNRILRVDYQNNNPNNFDEEEVINSDGKTVSVTKRFYTLDGEQMFEKHIFGKDGEINDVIVTVTDKNGKQIEPTTHKTPEEAPLKRGHVHVGTPVDGEWGDSQLQDIIRKKGGNYIGQE